VQPTDGVYIANEHRTQETIPTHSNYSGSSEDAWQQQQNYVLQAQGTAVSCFDIFSFYKVVTFFFLLSVEHRELQRRFLSSSISARGAAVISSRGATGVSAVDTISVKNKKSFWDCSYSTAVRRSLFAGYCWFSLLETINIRSVALIRRRWKAISFSLSPSSFAQPWNKRYVESYCKLCRQKCHHNCSFFSAKFELWVTVNLMVSQRKTRWQLKRRETTALRSPWNHSTLRERSKS
jgi:hypothetical protein